MGDELELLTTATCNLLYGRAQRSGISSGMDSGALKNLSFYHRDALLTNDKSVRTMMIWTSRHQECPPVAGKGPGHSNDTPFRFLPQIQKSLDHLTRPKSRRGDIPRGRAVNVCFGLGGKDRVAFCGGRMQSNGRKLHLMKPARPFPMSLHHMYVHLPFFSNRFCPSFTFILREVSAFRQSPKSRKNAVSHQMLGRIQIVPHPLP